MPTMVGVMADSYNAPASGGAIPLTGLQGWWDAADAATFTYSSGTVVSQWNDKSGNARHFSQGTVVNQPNRNGTQNGKTCLTFDGVNDYMDTAAFTLAHPYTIFLAVNSNAADTSQSFISSVGTNALQVYNPSSAMTVYSNGLSLGGTSATTPFGGVNVWSFEVNGATSAVYMNGASKVTGNLGSLGITTGLRLAERALTANNYFNGTLFEVIVYNRVLTTPERQQVESYLRTKWGTP